MLFATATAQDYQKNILSVRAGVNIANMKNGSISAGSRIGYHVGVSDQILITKSIPLYIETGLYASSRGAKNGTSSVNPLYLQVPVLVNYHIGIGEKFSIQPFAGAYYGLGIAGKSKVGDNKADFFGKDGLKRSEVGIRAGVGFELKRYYLGAGYEFGLNDISKGSGSKIKSNCITVSVGFKF